MIIHRNSGEATIFPLELQLGLVYGATPALAEVAARYMGEAGATQQVVLDRLRLQHAVRWGPERLRDVTGDVSQRMDRYRQEFQVLRVLELLEKADQSSGRCKPVLAVGLLVPVYFLLNSLNDILLFFLIIFLYILLLYAFRIFDADELEIFTRYIKRILPRKSAL